VKVVLSGDGGDELFAGYDRYVVDHRRRHLGLLGNLGLGGALRGLSAVLAEGAPGKNYLYNLSLPRMERYLDSISLFPPRALRDLLHPEMLSEVRATSEGALRAGEGLDPLSRLQDLDLRTYLPGDILTKLDRMTMAHSLEARVPLLDHPLVEFACGLPPSLRLRSGETKYLLKRVLTGRVPSEVLTRPKQGFAVPLDRWLGVGRRPFFREHLQNAQSVRDGYLNGPTLLRMLDLYERTGRPEFRRRLWPLFVFEVWYLNQGKN
jgi:asparagine synthase (glutamine-hydrolysing)